MSSIAFTFPGQGSQAVGMGKALYDASAAARAVFHEVDEALGQKLSTLMFEGPEDELTLTANAQPALMAVSMAAMAMLKENGVTVEKAAYVAGHSLGEYSALCAAGMFSLSDTAKLLRIRGNAMQAAVPVGAGAMAAIIGAEASDVAKLCADSAGGQICQIANDNGGGQLVISGSAAAIARAIEGAAAIGAKRAIPLSVSAPFHSALMQPAADAMRAALAGVAKHGPRVPVIANVTVSPLTDPETIAAKLVEQVTGQVRWRETVEWLATNNITTLYEIGSGKVLTGLAKRISKDIAGVAVNMPEDIEALAQSLA
jgi:[acyl-carrier-protein] S-malonyltransferase